MSIESLDLNRAFSYIGTIGDEESWEKFDAYHRDALRRLEASGADFAIIASNTPHHRFGAITSGIRMPVISIFEAVAKDSQPRRDMAMFEADGVVLLDEPFAGLDRHLVRELL